MAHQMVATSVPRGLDGVSGYQSVLKSAGIPPRVFDRLKARSGYSHRYPHGDSRNPVVYVHRIEELAGVRWHVLGSIRDAGSDHTGRSNFLAHMLAIEPAEARGKPGGPAAAAMARGCFLEKWDRPPEPAAPAKTLVAADRPPQPGEAPAWTAAGLDPGLAGDLAAAAMTSRKVVIVTRPGDDVLALFADALRLVEPAKRWGVTFNTCAIEDFDGTWKAVRSDLTDAKDLRDGKATVIDLTTNPRGSADPHARFARGELDALPWQKPAADAATKAEPDRGNALASAATTAEKPAQAGRLPQKSTGKKTTVAGESSRRERRPRYEEKEPSRFPWPAIAIGTGGLLLVGLLAAIPFRNQILGWEQLPSSRPDTSGTTLGPTPATPPPGTVENTPEFRAATKRKDARARLEEVAQSGKVAELLEDAKQLNGHLSDLGPVEEQSEINGDLKKIRAACAGVTDVLNKGDEQSPETFEKAKKSFEDAAVKLRDLETKVQDLAAKKKDQKAKAEAEATVKRRQQAFAAFQSLRKAVSLPTAIATSDTDIEGGSSIARNNAGPDTIDLGPFALADLGEPQVRLAVPRDTIEGSEFKADIVKVEGQSVPTWQIRYLPAAVNADGKPQHPRTLASLFARDGRLFLEVPRSNELGQQWFALLRRSVILVGAKDPDKLADPAVVQQIRLVEPTTIEPVVIDLFAKGQQQVKINTPKGIAREVGGPNGASRRELPIDSLRFEAEFPKIPKVNLELPKDVGDPTQPGIGFWSSPLAQLNPKSVMLARIEVSLPDATMTVSTEFAGPNKDQFEKDKVRAYFIDKPEQQLKNAETSFRQRVNSRKPDVHWFNQKLAPSTNMPMPLPGHEKILASFEMFLKEQHSEDMKGKDQKYKSPLPQTFENFKQRCMDDEKEFDREILKWGNWFWPRFKAQWHEYEKQFQAAVKEKHVIRITAITSLAYDEKNEVYEVPLVVLDDKPEATPAAALATPATPTPPAAVGIE